MAIRRRLNITGQDKVIANLNKEIRGMKDRSRGGMKESALLVRRESMKQTPVLTGNLKGSHYTEIISDLRHGVGAEIGLTASYAPYVHENLDAHHKNGRARFLALALVENARNILQILARHARIKK